MTVREAMGRGVRALRDAGVPDAGVDAMLLLSHVTGLRRTEVSLRGAENLTEEQEQRFLSLLLSRASRRPLQYVLGEQCFFGLDFLVDERVLIPRPETETLCEIALGFLKELPSPTALDLGTGSGAIAIVLQHECPEARVTAVDISPDALAVVTENARRNRADIRFLQGDLFAPVAGERFDCIVSNPPYVERDARQTLPAEVLWEPELALDGGEDGLAFYRAIAREAPAHLFPDGLLCVEIGETQARAVCGLLEGRGMDRVAVHRDLSGKDRVVCARAVSFP